MNIETLVTIAKVAMWFFLGGTAAALAWAIAWWLGWLKILPRE